MEEKNNEIEKTKSKIYSNHQKIKNHLPSTIWKVTILHQLVLRQPM